MKCCQCCDKIFSPSQFQPNQRFCSRKCRVNAYHRVKRGLGLKLALLVCVVCDKVFKQKRANNTRFCCTRCKRIALGRQNKGRPVHGPLKHVKGSGYITAQGYKILSLKHPNSSKRGQILEHVYVMSQHLGRPLKKGETVHHINGIRDDNRIENLEVWHRSQPPGQRIDQKLSWCKELLEQYGYAVIIE